MRRSEPVWQSRERRGGARSRARGSAALALLAALGLGPVAGADAPQGAKPPPKAPAPAPAPASQDPLAPRAPKLDDPFARSPSAPDPLAVLREVDRTWLYERVQGESLAKLGPPPSVREAPRVRCKVVAWPLSGPLAGSHLECEPLGVADGPAGPAWKKHLIFDGVGVREVEDERELADRSRTGGLTFPRVLDGRWKMDERGAGNRRTQVMVREVARDEVAPVRGAAEKLWVAETAKWPSATPSAKGPDLEVVQLRPGFGPVLLCTKQGLDSQYQCLRFVEEPPAELPPAGGPAGKPRPQPPQAERVTISKTQTHDPSTLKPAQVTAKISSSYLSAVRRCYQTTLAKRPGARGALTLDFTVNAVGKVEGVSVTGFDTGLAACVQTAVTAWRFPIPMSAYAEPRAARFSVGLALTPS